MTKRHEAWLQRGLALESIGTSYASPDDAEFRYG
jgi:hypothetical protein